MTQRIKGQEVRLSFTDPQGEPEDMNYVLSFEWELDMEILSEDFLGHTAKEYDDIFHGVNGSAELQLPGPGFFRFQERVQARAQRREAANGTFSATSSFSFPNGVRARIAFLDLKFGTLAVRTSGRSEYVTASFPWSTNTIRRIF